MNILKKRKGFTLLEILMVIIIIGVLAALAIPQYLRVVARGKSAEAITNIGIIRSAQIRYFAEFGKLALLGDLDVQNPNDITGRRFTYAVTGATLDDMAIRATPICPSVTPHIEEVKYPDGVERRIRVHFK